jgi:methionine-rich copper-binding protein CopC
LDERDVLGLTDMARALEHHVLEQVSEARLARHLVLGADVVPQVDCHDGRQVVLGHDDPQTVVKMLVAEGDLWDGGRHDRPLAWAAASRDRIDRQILAPAPELGVDTSTRGRRRRARRRIALVITHRSARRIAAAIFACLLALCVPASVVAHSELKTPAPAATSVQTNPVNEVSGIFTEALKKNGSSLELLDASGTSLAKGGVDPADDTRMVIDLDAPLEAGAYTVKWTSVATDGDILRGEWKFAVAAPPTPSPTPVPTPLTTVAASAPPSANPSPTPTATPSPTPSAGPSPSGEGTATAGAGDVLLPIIVALIVLGAGAAYLLNRRNRPASPV